MRNRAAIFWMTIVIGLCTSVRAQEIVDVQSIDPAYFMAGLLTDARWHYKLPQCYVEHRNGGGQHRVEMFLFMAQAWAKKANISEPVTHYDVPGGEWAPGEEWLVVENWPLAESVRVFFLEPSIGRRLDPDAPPTFASQEVVIAKPTEKLSYLAGVYADCYNKDRDVFHGPPSLAMRNVVILLLMEGCEISNLTIDHAVPTSMEFKVKPSAKVAAVFALVDRWQPPLVDWKTR